MKRIFALLLIIVLVNSFWSCGKQETAPKTDDSSSEISSETESDVSKPESTVDSKAGDSTNEDTNAEKETEKTTTSEASSTTPASPSENYEPVEEQQDYQVTPAECNHTSVVNDAAVPATCTTSGLTAGSHCSVCNAVITAQQTTQPTGHNYVNGKCSICGAADNKALYDSEYEQLTNQYLADIAYIQSQIDACNAEIIRAQQAINNANSSKAALSPTAPSSYIQSFVSAHWREYGDTYTATQVAQSKYAQEYQSKLAQYNSTISTNQTALSVAQSNLATYNTQMQTTTATYQANVSALKVKYGIS